MCAVDATLPSEKSKVPRWGRREAAATLAAYEQRPPEQSQRQFAREMGVARSTLQHWLARKEGLDANPRLVEFLESPEGLAFLHRLLVAAHFTFNQVGASGVRLMSLFLRLSHLDRVVAASRTAQHDVAAAMERLIEQFGRTEKERLAATMAPKRIGLCEDETFFRGLMCLVGMEPLSGFLLLEKFSHLRDEATWTEEMKAALAGLKVEIEQLVSDEARGLRAHARDGLGVHHGPDLFHSQQDLGKATTVALQSRINQAAEDLLEARQNVHKRIEEHSAYRSVRHGPGRPPDFEQRIAKAQAAERVAEEALREAEARRTEVKEARAAISELYHPFDLATGQSRSAEALEAGLEEQFGRIESSAAAARLSQASQKLIAKARRLLPSMVATVAFFFARIRLAIEELQLEPELEALVQGKLIPGLYIQRIAEQAPSAERRAELRLKAQELLAEARQAGSALEALPQESRRAVEQAARRCAEMFVRSSSCVEGRNGQLSLRHHSLHHISDRKLAVLTTIHNYFLRRADGTTAAERFFGSKPQDLFECLLDRIDLPARPAKQRPRKVVTLL